MVRGSLFKPVKSFVQRLVHSRNIQVRLLSSPQGTVENPESDRQISNVMSSNMANADKTSVVKSLLALQFKVQLKEKELQFKDNEVKSKIEALETKNAEIRRIQAERDYLNGTLYARYILERYEARLDKTDIVGDKSVELKTRFQKWEKHLRYNPEILEALKKCDRSVDWGPGQAVDSFNTFSRSIHNHKPTALGNGEYLVTISKGLKKKDFCFVKVMAKRIYGDSVKVGETDDENEDG